MEQEKRLLDAENLFQKRSDKVPHDDDVPCLTDGILDDDDLSCLTKTVPEDNVVPCPIRSDYVPVFRKANESEWMMQNGLVDPENVPQKRSDKVPDPYKIMKLPLKLNDLVLGSREVNGSVQSLAPYILSREWMMENGLLKPEHRLLEQEKQLLDAENLLQKQSDKIPDDVGSCLKDGVQEDDVLSCSTKMIPEENVPCWIRSEYAPVFKKANESVWSVESLAAYVPSTEWMIQNGLLDPETVAKKVSDTTDSQSVLSNQVMSLMEESHSQMYSASSIDSLPTYVPSASWLADVGNVYYHSMVPSCSLENVNAFSTPMDKLSPRKRPGMDSEVLPSKHKESKLRRGLDMEPMEKLDLGNGSPALLSGQSNNAASPSIEGRDSCNRQGSAEPEAQSSPNQNVPEQRAQKSPCSPKDPEEQAPKCLAGDKSPGPRNQEIELKETTAQIGLVIPSQPECEWLVIDACIKMHKVSPSQGHPKISSLKCSKPQEGKGSSCEEHKQSTGHCRKSPEPMQSNVDDRKSPEAKQSTVSPRRSLGEKRNPVDAGNENLTKMSPDIKSQERRRAPQKRHPGKTRAKVCVCVFQFRK